MDQYRVFGNPIKQSRSPIIHQSFAEQTQQQLNYQSEYVELDQFEQTVKDFAKNGGKGANITVPFKEQALRICDQLTERARLAGAVNTLCFVDGKILGDNTDGQGLVQDLLNNKVQLKTSRILLLGAGGAAKGVILPLLAQLPESIVIANRTIAKAENLIKQFNNKKLSALGFAELGDEKFDLIINATSASLSGNVPPIAKELAVNTYCYDMVYGNELTPFLQWAKDNGATKVMDGLGMLVGQAAESFRIWRDVHPEVISVLHQLR
ncbi:MAG: shikimate dehydrogenase [Colwellia sp.]|nr:shikimate dehydrogenase [Colwellia sp.]